MEEVDVDLESKGRPLVEEFGEEGISIISQDYKSPSRKPVIEEINERFTRLNNPPNKPSRPLIEELYSVDDFNGRSKNSKPSITEMSREGTAVLEAATAEPKESELSAEAESQPLVGPSWETLQKLAEQVGSTIEREPLDIDKERKAFVERMRDTNLGDLD